MSRGPQPLGQLKSSSRLCVGLAETLMLRRADSRPYPRGSRLCSAPECGLRRRSGTTTGAAEVGQLRNLKSGRLIQKLP
ncbi:hypothetical protein NDU88_004755 [Pleurodeles waltl]|uniref:Uncharacterized protein n=1 Tax=Pleurodeles waltl TaxID=8319 RepID=A0AAV7UG32_PLEWA|nr:hypothetical protein NDU88_004755 [Pleurodeles waltl]